jgi:hypothetical protein
MALHGINPRPRRVKRLQIGGDMLLHLLKGLDGRHVVSLTGLPRDARCIGMATGMATADYAASVLPNTIAMLIESQEFDELPAAEPYPELELEVTWELKATD